MHSLVVMLVAGLIFFPSVSGDATTSTQKWATNGRFKLATYGTHVFLDSILWTDAVYLYNDKVQLVHAQMGSGNEANMTISVQNADLTINQIDYDDQTQFTLNATNQNTVATIILGSKPTKVKVGGVEYVENDRWSWDTSSNTLTTSIQLVDASTSIAVLLNWKPFAGPPGGGGGGGGPEPSPTPTPTPEPSSPPDGGGGGGGGGGGEEPPVNPPFVPPVTPPVGFEPTPLNLGLIGAAVITIIILGASATGELREIGAGKKNRKAWRNRLKTKQKKNKWKSKEPWS